MPPLFDPSLTTVEVQAVYFRGVIDLKAFRAKHPQYPVLLGDPLLIEVVRGQYAALAKFGSVVFWNCTDAHVSEVVAAVTALQTGEGRDERIRERLRVRLNDAEPPPGTDLFNEIPMREPTQEKLKVVSMAVAQSVALEHFELAVDTVLRGILPGWKCCGPRASSWAPSRTCCAMWVLSSRCAPRCWPT